MSSDFSRPVDAWSRFVAYCSLVVALGTLGWVWLDGGTSTRDVSSGNGIDTAKLDQLFEKETAEQEQRNEAWRAEQAKLNHAMWTDATTSYKNSADSMLAEHHALIQQLRGGVLPATFTAGDTGATPSGNDLNDSEPNTPSDTAPEETKSNDPLADIANPATKIADMKPKLPGNTLTIGDPSEAATDLAKDDGAGNAKDADEVLSTEDSEGFFSPLLTHVIQTRKPDGSDDDTGIVTIRNTGNGKAMLTRIQFTPSQDYDAIFEVDSPTSLSTAPDDDVVEIVFTDQDNLADESGKHGVYKRELPSTDFGVNGGDAMRLRLAIANEKHLGWGFRGRLEISYNGLDPLVVEDAELVFVSVSQPIVQK